MECSTPIHYGKVCSNFERLNGKESFDACLFEWLSRNRLVELSISCISTIHGFEWNEFGWIWGQVWCMLFLYALGIITVYKLVRSAFQDSIDMPRPSECILEFVNGALFCIWPNHVSGKDDVANRVDVRVWALCVDELTMVQMLFLDQNLGDFATCRQARSKFFWIRHDGAGQRCKLQVLPAGVVNWKCKFLANGNQTARDIHPGHRARVSGINQEQNGLKCYSDRIAFIAHDF